MWQQAFAAGNRRFEAAELSEEDQLRWKYQRYIKSYIASVRSMDRQIGRLLDYLEAHDLMENTLVIYSSDQGFFLGENGWFDKRWMDEVSSRVPLLMQWPGHIAARHHLGCTGAEYRLRADAAGRRRREAKNAHARRQPAAIVCSDRQPTLNPGSATCTTTSTKIPAFTAWRATTACAQQRYKLVYYYQNDEWELFDLQTDPGDQVNLYGKPGYDDITSDLKQRLQALRTQYQVPEADPQAPWYHGAMVRLWSS